MSTYFPTETRSERDESRYVFFDVETPNGFNDRICSFALVYDDDSPTLSSLVDPETFFHPVNVQIHGITPRAVQGKPRFPQAWLESLREEFASKVVVGYNVTFDLRVLSKTLRHYALPRPQFRYVDVLPAARRFFDLPSYSLSDVMEELGVSFRHHDARDDSFAAKIAFQKIRREAPELLIEKIYQYKESACRGRW